MIAFRSTLSDCIDYLRNAAVAAHPVNKGIEGSAFDSASEEAPHTAPQAQVVYLWQVV